MNERIKELIKQCTSWSEGSTWTSHEEFDKEKFAELIVKECVESIPADGHRGDFGRAVEFCQQQIKQHFGVEE
jgi:hypothetical protein